MGEKSDKLQGKGKQLVGKSTNNKELQAKGKLEEVKGDLKGKGSDVAGTVEKKLKD